MTPFALLTAQVADQALQFLLMTSLKISAMLGLTLVAVVLLRRSSAALRHWALTLALMATLALPVTALVSPTWSLALLPSLPTTAEVSTNPAQSKRSSVPFYKFAPSDALNGSRVTKYVPATTSAVPVNKVKSNPPVESATMVVTLPLSPSAWLLLVWMVGAFSLVARYLWQFGVIWRITSRGILPDAVWNTLLTAQAARLGLKRPVRLMLSAQVHIPMTWGWRRPVILMPIAAQEWDTERRCVVLLHELAHIVRNDYLTQWIALTCCALNWFNPLTWWAARQMAVEREQASDDLVLNVGVRSTEYATHLLEIARSAIHKPAFQMLTLAMARRSALERRIRGILNPRQPRRVYQGTRLLLVAILLLSLLPLSGLHLTRVAAQSDSITLSLAMIGQQDVLADSLSQFEADHPGVHVVLVDALKVPDAGDNLEGHLTAMEQYANAADVMFFDGYNMSITPLDTRAHYILDMAPLINTDASFPLDDFYPQLWSSFQWDRGIWGIPLGADMVVMNYDQAAFDRENMAYPDGQWTFSEFMDAVKQLTVKDANGNVTAAGFANSGRIFREAFWRSLMDADAVDATSLPNQPQFTRPDVEAVLDGYHQLEQQGLINGDANTAAMFIDSARKMPPDGHGWALLPGNKAVLLPFGLAISAGTQHPDLAYDLVKYLSGQNITYGSLPARKSLTEANGVGSMVMPDWQPLIEAGFTNSLTYSNLRFADYLNAAWGAADGSASTHDLLQTLEARAISDLSTADAKRETVVISVTEPTLPTVPDGKIVLNFDMVRAKQTQETHDEWVRVAQDFAATDPQVGLVNLREMGDPASMSAANSDCFYAASNAVPSIDPTMLLSLDPLLNADASFDRADLIGNVLTAVQRDGSTLALPLNLNPFILRYDAARFTAANLPEPAATWTVEDFNNALDALKPASEGHAPFVDNTTGGGYLLVLIASYGGLPLDYRTTPPSIHFTDAATVDAIRQVLDFAKNGGIAYSAVGNFGDGLVAFPNNTTAIYSSMLDGFGRKLPRGAAPDKAAMFPMGRDYNGVAYDLGAGYISAQTQYPEACYRFLQTLSQHPELFASMPVRHSVLTSPAFQATVTPDLLAVYEQMDALLTDPKTVAFPVDSNGGVSVTDFLLQHWLFQAFDSYVLNSGDLDEALANAEQMAMTFQTCVANLPPLDPIVDKGGDNSALVPYVDCAELADSNLKPLLDPMVGRS